MKQFLRTMLAATMAFASLFALLKVTSANETLAIPARPAQDELVFLPIIYGSTTPAGAYYCYEWEFGLIWTSETITLNVDASSIYAYNPPYADIVTGSWVYTPSTKEVGFTNFRWLTTTFQPPDRLWASRYLTYAGFEIAISCNRIK